MAGKGLKPCLIPVPVFAYYPVHWPLTNTFFCCKKFMHFALFLVWILVYLRDPYKKNFTNNQTNILYHKYYHYLVYWQWKNAFNPKIGHVLLLKCWQHFNKVYIYNFFLTLNRCLIFWNHPYSNNSACWEMFHDFLLSADFFSKLAINKILSGIPAESQTVNIQIRPDILSSLICVQTVHKGYQ